MNQIAIRSGAARIIANIAYLIVIVWVNSMTHKLAMGQEIQPSLQIISPADGMIVTPGQTIQVSVTALNNVQFAKVVVTGEYPIGFSNIATSAPYGLTLTLPAADIKSGNYLLTAWGVTTAGQVAASQPIHLDVERTDLPTALMAFPPRVIFESPNQQIPIRITASFSDNNLVDITASSTLTYISADPNIATIDQQRLITAVGAGSTSIKASVSRGAEGVEVVIPVVVPPPTLMLSSSFLIFDDQALAVSSIPKKLTITNAGNAPLKIFEISVDGDFIQANDCINPGAIAVGASCIVQVSFIPTAIGNRTGNLNITSSFTITPIMASLSGTGVDKTPPITAAIFSPFPNANGWNNSNITINLRAVDNPGGSGVQQISFSSAGAQFIPITDIVGNSASATISAEGITSFNFFATDLAGNIEPPHTTTIKIDKTPPSSSGSQTPAANAAGWNNTDVTVTFACSDALSGLAPGSPPAPTVLTSEGANQQVTGTCQDLAGNVASVTISRINIDKTTPALSGLPVADCTLWPPNHKFVTVATISATDALSGLASLNVTGASNEPMDPNDSDIRITGTGAQPRIVQLRAERLGTGTGRVYTLITTATDLAGNIVTVTSTCTVPHDQGQ